MLIREQSTMKRLRRAIGIIGLTLPLVFLAGVVLFGVPMQNSISEFFFTGLREVFVSASAGVGLFLLAYQGYPKRPGEILSDRLLTDIAGASVFATAFIPTLCRQSECYHPLTLFDQLIPSTANGIQGALHLGAAGIFLSALGLISLRLFTRSGVNMTIQKQRRNHCYRAFGWIILSMVATLATVKLGFPRLGQAWDTGWHFTFWTESIALWAFGLSWLLKGEAMTGAMPFLFDPETS